MNISRPPEHRWKQTHYTHTLNSPYRHNMCFFNVLQASGMPFKDAVRVVDYDARQFAKAQMEGLL